LNQDKGVLASRDGLRLSATELFNGGGCLLSSQKGIDVSLAGAFDNQAGSLDSRGFLTVKSARLDNQGGTLSSAGALAVTS
ncbi:hypothetical protein KQ721_15395, partial [Listeria monocytogenes]|nr:hypothetical protein [Listeria monocytogenes]